MQARDLLFSASKGGPKLAQVKQLLEEAVRRDPKFALGFALLSETETFFAVDNDSARAGLLEEAKAHAEEALGLARPAGSAYRDGHLSLAGNTGGRRT